MMNTKTTKIIYWTGVLLTVVKEWVFAGVYFDILFAFFSKWSVLGFASTIDAMIAFAMVTVTYFLFRRLYPVTQVIVAVR